MLNSAHGDVQEWRLIVLELFRAQEAYLRAMKGKAGSETIERTWDRLQEASRRRDDFLGGCTAHGHDKLPKRA